MRSIADVGYQQSSIQFQHHLIMTNKHSQPDFHDATKEYLLRELIHSKYQPENNKGNNVGLKLVVETSRESRRRLARQKKQTRPTTTFNILNQLN